MVLGNSVFDNGERLIHPNNYGYKISTNQWINFGQLSVPKHLGGGAIYDNKILVSYAFLTKNFEFYSGSITVKC